MADAKERKPPAPDVSGRMVGGFQIIRKLGQGAMGAVFLARQVSVDRKVALKVLSPRLARNREYVQRFLREAHAAAQLHHANIVEAIDVGQADGYYYLAMEFVDGRDLRQILDQNGALPEAAALRVARQIADALDDAHTTAGIIHRDIKPENILVTKKGVPKLTDLGLAREVDRSESSLTKTGVALGTPNYISPEQVRGETDLDGRTDLYSLGATLYHLVTGSPPYIGGTATEVMAKHLSDTVPDPRAANPQVSPATAALIRKALMKHRAQRYQTARALADDIDRVLAAEAAAESPTAPAGPRRSTVSTVRRRQRQRRSPWRAVIAVAAAILLVALLWAAVAPGPEADRPAPPPGSARTGPVAAKVPRPEEIDTTRPAPVETGPTETERRAKRLAGLRRQARDAFSDLLEEAKLLAQADDYDSALALFSPLPEECTLPELPAKDRAAFVQQAETEKARLAAEAEGKIRPGLSEAEQLARKNELDKALERVEQLEQIKYQPLAREIKDRHGRLEAAIATRDDDARKKALAAARTEAIRRLLAQNVELHKTYAAKCADKRTEDVKKVKAKYSEQWERTKSDIGALTRRISENTRKLRDATRIRDKILDHLREGRRKRDGVPGRPFRRGGERLEGHRKELEEAIARDRRERTALARTRAKLEATLKSLKTTIDARDRKRKKLVKSAYEQNKEELLKGAELTEAAMTERYKAALELKPTPAPGDA